jgi:hypothetical protein
VPKSQFIKIVDETSKKMKWVEAPISNSEIIKEEKSKSEDDSGKPEEKKNEEKKIEINDVNKKEKSKSPSKIQKISPKCENLEDNMSSEENGVELVINENDDTLMIEEKLKENTQVEDSKIDYIHNEVLIKENKRESKAFNLAEEMEKSDVLGNILLEKRSNSKDYNSLIPSNNSIPLSKSISHKIKNKKEKNAQDCSISMNDYNSTRTDRKNFNNYAQIKQYISGKFKFTIRKISCRRSKCKY